MAGCGVRVSIFKEKPMPRHHLAWIAAAACLLAPTVFAQESDEEEYKVQLPDVSIYKAMLDANKTTGWVQFRNFSGKQLVYFTPLQTMHCRLSEIRYSINSDALDKRFPLGKCNPHIPFSIPETDTVDYVYTSFPAGSVKTIAVQAVWDDGAGSEIVIYKPARAWARRPARRSRRSRSRSGRRPNPVPPPLRSMPSMAAPVAVSRPGPHLQEQAAPRLRRQPLHRPGFRFRREIEAEAVHEHGKRDDGLLEGEGGADADARARAKGRYWKR